MRWINTSWYVLVALVIAWFSLVMLAVALGAFGVSKPLPSIPGLSAQVSALNHRVRLLEDEVNHLQRPRVPQVQPGRVGRYCVESAAGLLECTDCRFIKQDTTIVKDEQ